mmetsp:Transcript_39432/g.68337  ORF Transcript_39432/g.68337 Transcript_39432/m.68337 type:complete len:388 (-) Transcript_39432:467-1630(-)
MRALSLHLIFGHQLADNENHVDTQKDVDRNPPLFFLALSVLGLDEQFVADQKEQRDHTKGHEGDEDHRDVRDGVSHQCTQPGGQEHDQRRGVERHVAGELAGPRALHQARGIGHTEKRHLEAVRHGQNEASFGADRHGHTNEEAVHEAVDGHRENQVYWQPVADLGLRQGAVALPLGCIALDDVVKLGQLAVQGGHVGVHLLQHATVNLGLVDVLQQMLRGEFDLRELLLHAQLALLGHPVAGLTALLVGRGRGSEMLGFRALEQSAHVVELVHQRVHFFVDLLCDGFFLGHGQLVATLEKFVRLVLHALHNRQQFLQVLANVAAVLWSGNGLRCTVHWLILPLVPIFVVRQVSLAFFKKVGRSSAFRISESALARAAVITAHSVES